LLTEIQPAIDEEVQSLATPFNYGLTLEVLRREAKALIGSEKANEAVEKENAEQTTSNTGRRTTNN
jgi:hypothetical protein